MSTWDELDVLDHVLNALSAVHVVNPDGHHFGTPWATAYQLAIKVHTAQPAIAAALGVTLGGQGTGSRNSLAQYLARELSRRIRAAGGDFPIQGVDAHVIPGGCAHVIPQLVGPC